MKVKKSSNGRRPEAPQSLAVVHHPRQVERNVKRDIVLIGGSAGSLAVAKKIVSGLSKDFSAAVCVVIHTTPRGRSELAALLGRGALPACEAREGALLESGRIYVAPPDRHLLIGDGHMHVTRGPKEGLHRPSINVTFRSAAETHGPRVIGVLLSGMLDDGASGLWEIGRRGGVAIIQDPHEAEYPSMPLNALHDAPVHFQLRSDEIAPVLRRLIAGESVPEPLPNVKGHQAERFSGITCPECHGPLYRRELAPSLVEFRCRVGHVFSPNILLEEHTSTQERKLYEAVVALEEGADLAEFIAGKSQGEKRLQLMNETRQLRQHAAGIRAMIEERMMPSPDPSLEAREKAK
jgi:two-component system chemotaxis response regulator CheB